MRALTGSTDWQSRLRPRVGPGFESRRVHQCLVGTDGGDGVAVFFTGGK